MKRNVHSSWLIIVISMLTSVGQVYSGDVYKKELTAFITKPDVNYIFDKKVDPAFAFLHKDIENYKELSCVERLARLPFMLSEAVVVTRQTMPNLYAYIDALCKKNNIATPTVFISTRKSIFNAFAAKLFTSAGGILICQKLLIDASDSELEAVVAHEIGHIKHNHTNKTLLLNIGLFISIWGCIDYLSKKSNCSQNVTNFFIKTMMTDLSVSLIAPLIINKRFEKQADEFACNQAGKSQGLIKFFEGVEKRELDQEKQYRQDCLNTQTVLEDNKSQLSDDNYAALEQQFAVIKFQYKIMNWSKWLYYNTPYGAHPSHQERIAAAKKYVSDEDQE